MAQCKIHVLNFILSFVPIVCISMLAISTNFIVISLNPSVEWSTYKQDLGYGMEINYFHTIWTYLDKGVIEGVVQGVPKYSPILKDVQKSDWKIPIRYQLYRSCGILGGATLAVVAAAIIHGVTKQKLFVIICNVASIGLGVAAGYFNIQITKHYKDSLFDDVSKNGKHMYHSELNTMTLGYHLVFYGTVLAIVASGLLLLYIGLYIPFGDGKWVWTKTTDVIPETEVKCFEASPPPKATLIKRKKSDIVVQELNQI